MLEDSKRSSVKRKSIRRESITNNNLEKLRDNRSIGQFSLGEKLGQGTFGKVRLATHLLTGEKVFIQ